MPLDSSMKLRLPMESMELDSEMDSPTPTKPTLLDQFSMPPTSGMINKLVTVSTVLVSEMALFMLITQMLQPQLTLTMPPDSSMRPKLPMESTEQDLETDSPRLPPILLLLFKPKLSMSGMTSRELDSKPLLRKLGLRKKLRMPR